MKRLLSAAALTLACIAPLPAMAWGAIAAGGNQGVIGVSVDADTPQDAIDIAMADCKKRNMFCQIQGKPYRATAVFVGQVGGKTFVQHDPDPDLALRRLKGVCQVAGNDQCSIEYAAWDSGATWMAVSSRDDVVRVSSENNTKAEAEQSALFVCHYVSSSRAAGCKVLPDYSTNELRYIAIARRGSEETLYVYISANSMAEAEEEALKTCASKQHCTVTNHFTNTGPTPIPASFKAILGKLRAGEKF